MSALTLTYDDAMRIPAGVFQSAHIQKGDKIEVLVEGDTVVLRREVKAPAGATLVMGKFGRKVLRLPEGAPPITTESVKELLDELDLP